MRVLLRMLELGAWKPHPDDRPLKLALEELGFFAREVRVLGTYPAHPYRIESERLAAQAAGDD